jgi:hypothetical protein
MRATVLFSPGRVPPMERPEIVSAMLRDWLIPAT